MRIGQKTMAILVVGVILGAVAIASAAGVYVTAKGSGGGATLPAAGSALPMDIKGSMTFGAVADGFGIPIADLATAFRLPPASARGFQLKNLESLGLGDGSGFEVGVASVRWFVALYKGLAYAPPATAGLTSEAVALLLEKAPLDEATKALLSERTVGAG
jgi:hypothetical protein